MQQLVGVQRALHQKLGFALGHQRHGGGSRRIAVGRVDQPVRRNVHIGRLGRRFDLGPGTDQYGRDQSCLGCFHCRADGIGVAGMGDRCGQRRQTRRACQERAKTLMSAQLHVRQLHLRQAHLLARRAHQGAALGHAFIRLIDAETIEHDLDIAAVLGPRRDGGGDLVVHGDRFKEAQHLFQIDGARAGQLGAQHTGDQSAAEPAMGDRLGHGQIFRAIHQAGAGVAGDQGEEIHVLAREGSGEAGALADGDFVEGSVFQDRVGHAAPVMRHPTRSNRGSWACRCRARGYRLRDPPASRALFCRR